MCLRSSATRGGELRGSAPVKYEHPHSAVASSDPTAIDVPALASGQPSFKEYDAEVSYMAGRSDFGTPSLSSKWSPSTTGGRDTSASDPDAATQVVKKFVRDIVKGITLEVLCAGGSATEIAVVSLDRKLRTMYMQRAGKKDAKRRQIRLEQVIEIAVGSDVREEVELPVDDQCVTLLLDNYQALSFRFPDVEERDTFALCLSMFVDGRREEVFKQSHKDQAA